MTRRLVVALIAALVLLAGSDLARSQAALPSVLAPVVPVPPPAPAPVLPAFSSPAELPTFARPVATGRINGGFSRIHPGLDFSVPTGAPVLASEQGVVAYAGWSYWGYGNLVVIDHEKGFQTWYGHLHRIDVEAGQAVRRAQLIGQAGNTGNSEGSHLHFEIRQGCVFHHLLTGEVIEDGIAQVYRRDPFGKLRTGPSGTLICPEKGD